MVWKTPHQKTTVTESIEGPDGKIYALFREGAKYILNQHLKVVN